MCVTRVRSTNGQNLVVRRRVLNRISLGGLIAGGDDHQNPAISGVYNRIMEYARVVLAAKAQVDYLSATIRGIAHGTRDVERGTGALGVKRLDRQNSTLPAHPGD